MARSVLSGGLAAEAGGGKFYDGARTAAFMWMLVETANYYQDQVGPAANPMPGENREGQSRYELDGNGRQKPSDQS